MAIEVTEVKAAAKFPRAYKAISGEVVLFFGRNDGVVIASGDNSSKVGHSSSGWTRFDNNSVWEPVNLTITHD